MSDNIPYGTLRDIAEELKNIRCILERQSTTEQSPMVGKWKEFAHSGIHTCSNCEVPRISSELKTDYKYCPNCGAKMKGVI